MAIRWLLRAAFGIVALGMSATGASAVDVAYSQGVLTFNDARRITVGFGGDFASCDAAFASIPKDGAGGIIEFLPGNHTTTCGNLGKRGNILITGRLGPNGERPVITTPKTVHGNGLVNYEPFIVVNSDAPDNFAIQNIEIVDTGAALNAWNFGGMVLRNVKIDNTHDADAVKAFPTFNWNVGGYAWQSFLEIYDSEVSRGGSANSRHNFYIGRIDRVLVDGLYSHSAQQAHAFKSIARNNEIYNSTFATTELSFEDALLDPYLSSTLVDLSACANSTIRNNTFSGLRIELNDRPEEARAGVLGTTTASFIDLRRRKTDVGGCDVPRYEDIENFDWEGAAAEGYARDNDDLFHHVIEDNTFINEGDRDIYLVRNIGTTYVEDNNQSFIRGENLPLPDDWFERSVAWVKNNEKIGNIPLGDDWESNFPGEAGLKAPIFDLDRYDVVKIAESSSSPGLALANISLTLHQFDPNAATVSLSAHATSVDGPPSIWLAGSAVGLLLIYRKRRRRRAG